MRVHSFIPMIALFACNSETSIVSLFDETTELVSPEVFSFSLDSPTYGEFTGDEPAWVSGTVSPADAVVEIEGQQVSVATDGTFGAWVEIGGPYRNINVAASHGEMLATERVPVFSGRHPLETWPGGASLRLLPEGLDALGEALGQMIDDTGWSSQISSSLPGYEADWIRITPMGVSHDPTVVELTPADEGLASRFLVTDLTITYELAMDWAGYTEELSAGFGELAIGGTLIPWLDSDSMLWMSLTDATLALDDPEFDLGLLDGWVLELITDGLSEYIIEPLAETILDLVLDSVGEMEVGGPFAFQFDLLGMAMDIALTDVYGDLDGLGAELGVGLNEPAAGDVGLPVPTIETPYAAEAHAAIGLHEGVFQLLADEAIVMLLSQELALDGTYGDLLGAGLTSLPGGDQAPDGDGWCLALEPGSAYVARIIEGEGALAGIYLPDLVLDAGIKQGSDCETWLKASLATEMSLGLNGTEIDLDITVPDGVVLEYGAEGADEAAVIEGLGTYLSSMIGLLGGVMGDLDLGSLGGLDEMGLGEISPEFVGNAPLESEDGTWIEGLYSVAMTLWQ